MARVRCRRLGAAELRLGEQAATTAIATAIAAANRGSESDSLNSGEKSTRAHHAPRSARWDISLRRDHRSIDHRADDRADRSFRPAALDLDARFPLGNAPRPVSNLTKRRSVSRRSSARGSDSFRSANSVN